MTTKLHGVISQWAVILLFNVPFIAIVLAQKNTRFPAEVIALFRMNLSRNKEGTHYELF